MIKEFSLEAILSIISGINYCGSFDKVYEVFRFAYNNPYINASEIFILRDELTRHILRLHPELNTIKFINDTEFIDEQKKIYGETLSITRMKSDKNRYIKIKTGHM